MANWSYSVSTNTYMNGDTGELVTSSELRAIRDGLADSAKGLAREAAARLNDSLMSENSFVRAMDEIALSVIAASYMVGRGGENAMRTDDWDRVSEASQVQNGHLDAWVKDGASTTDSAGGSTSTRSIRTESSDQIDARAAMYANSGIAAYGEGQLAAWGVELPLVPGDGSTLCSTNCRCHLSFDQQDDGSVDIYWETEEDGEVCLDCQALGDIWNPLTIDGVGDDGAPDDDGSAGE